MGARTSFFLQETHVLPGEVERMKSLHAKQWGFRRGTTDRQLSFWSTATDRTGGVAMLLDPYGRLQNPQPCLTHHWTSNFTALTGTYAGATVILICVYAPHQRGKREGFYRRMGALDLPLVDKIVVGGDFNCTMDSRLDRSWYRQTSDNESPALANVLAKWGLVDAMEPPADVEHTNLDDYYEATHTYRYPVRAGVEATARLDRWYVSAPMVDWVAAVEVVRTGTSADHRAVRLHLRSPTDPVRVRKPAKVYRSPLTLYGSSCTASSMSFMGGWKRRHQMQQRGHASGMPSKWHCGRRLWASSSNAERWPGTPTNSACGDYSNRKLGCVRGRPGSQLLWNR